jgi:hypothetical protein
LLREPKGLEKTIKQLRLCVKGMRKVIDRAEDQHNIIFLVNKSVEMYIASVAAYWPGKRQPKLNIQFLNLLGTFENLFKRINPIA